MSAGLPYVRPCAALCARFQGMDGSLPPEGFEGLFGPLLPEMWRRRLRRRAQGRGGKKAGRKGRGRKHPGPPTSPRSAGSLRLDAEGL